MGGPRGFDRQTEGPPARLSTFGWEFCPTSRHYSGEALSVWTSANNCRSIASKGHACRNRAG